MCKILVVFMVLVFGLVLVVCLFDIFEIDIFLLLNKIVYIMDEINENGLIIEIGDFEFYFI